MVFQHDIKHLLKTFSGKYSAHLNSEDLHAPELALDCSRAKGGTLAMWRSDLDPYINIHPTNSSSVLALILDIPNLQTSIHVAIYLPTSGKESEFLNELSNLDTCLLELQDDFPSSPIFIRGDGNCNPKHKTRINLLNHIINKYALIRTPLDHTTYHHFIGEGTADSEIDILLHSSDAEETLDTIECKEENLLIDSHHDLIVSKFSLKTVLEPPNDTSENITAPKIMNDRVKILWDDENIPEYCNILGDSLNKVYKRWGDSSSRSSVSLLLSSTNSILCNAAKATNKYIQLAK